MNTDTTKPPYGVARIGRLELIVEKAKPENTDQLADVVAERVRAAGARDDGGNHGEIAEAITALMDIHDPEQRKSMPEAMFDTITAEKHEAPRRGDTIHDGMLTGLKIEVEDCWDETRVHDRTRLWSRKLRLTPTGPHAARSPWAPRNYAHGFWGTWSENNRARQLRIPVGEAWTAIFEMYGHKDSSHPDNIKLRLILDSSAGRHYADGVLDGVYNGKTPLRNVLRRCGPPPELDIPDAG